MPHTHTRRFRVRHYECDAFGHVNNAAYLRYMQESAFDASTAAGYSPARYAEMNRQWLVRETEIEYLTPLRYGDTVEVKTWVADFQRVTSRRVYEFYRQGEMVAKAHTDWVFLELSTGRPVAIPQPLAEAFFPEGAPDLSPVRAKFPEPPSPPPGVFTMRRRVEWRDIGPAGHVNNAVYLAYVDDCGFQVSAAHGWPLSRMAAEGLAIIVRRHRLQYRRPALLDEELEIATWASDIRQRSGTRHYTISRAGDGELLTRVQTVYVWVDIASGRPIRIPAQFLADFAPNIVGE
jgi:acyl-CoA thioester hydrolase